MSMLLLAVRDFVFELIGLCPRHGQLLKCGVAPIIYGYVVPSAKYLSDRRDLFPLAKSVVLGGCCIGRSKESNVRYCSACREAEVAWGAANPDDFINALNEHMGLDN